MDRDTRIILFSYGGMFVFKFFVILFLFILISKVSFSDFWFVYLLFGGLTIIGFLVMYRGWMDCKKDYETGQYGGGVGR